MTDWLIFFFLFGFAQLLVWKLKFFKTDKLPTWSANLLFTAKMLGGLLVFFIYAHYYNNRETADVFKFFDDAKTIHSIIHENREAGFKILFGFTDASTEHYESYMCSWTRMLNESMINENHLIIRLNAFFLFLTGGNYQLHNLIFCFLSFMGSWFLVLTLSDFLSERSMKMFFGVLLLPSVVLWTSGLLKESLLNFALGLVIWEYFKNPKRTLAFFAVILGFYLLFFTRSILGLIVLFSLFNYWIAQRFSSNRKILFSQIVVLCVVFIVAVIMAKTNTRFDYFKIISLKQQLIIKEAAIIKAGSLVDVPEVTDNPLSLLTGLPLGFLYGLIQPMPFQADGNKLVLLSGLENIFIICFVLYLLVNIRKPEAKRAHLFWFLVTIAVVYLAFIGLLIPVLGNLVRYKAIAIIIFCSGLLLIQKTTLPFKSSLPFSDKEKIVKRETI